MSATFIPSAEIVTVENYPYGFKLRTTLTDSMEFSPKHGFRHVTQTINPKTGRLNKPVKSTYWELAVRYYDENGHIKVKSLRINGFEEVNAACQFVGEYYDLFTPEQIEHLYITLIGMSKVSAKAKVIYAGAKTSDIIPLLDPLVKPLVRGLKDKGNTFAEAAIDLEAVKAICPEHYSPFTTVSHYSL